MGGITEGVKTFNSTIRTVILAAFVGIVGWIGYLGYSEYTANERLLESQQVELATLKGEIESKDATIGQLEVDVQEKLEQIRKLETSMQLLKTDQRLARLRVVSIERDEEGQALSSQLEFVELSPQGELLSDPKKFELPGDVVYVDNWIVKFEDKYIEKGDVERGTSLCLFRRIFSEDQKPSEGVSLDEVGMRPQAYASGGALSEFEQQLWSEFWEFANDRDKAVEKGIRAANGEAVSMKVQEGMTYSIELRASGGLSFKPVNTPTETDDPT